MGMIPVSTTLKCGKNVTFNLYIISSYEGVTNRRVDRHLRRFVTLQQRAKCEMTTRWYKLNPHSKKTKIKNNLLIYNN